MTSHITPPSYVCGKVYPAEYGWGKLGLSCYVTYIRKKTHLRSAMSQIAEEMGELHSAVTEKFADAEIVEYERRDDGSRKFTIIANGQADADMPQEPDTEDEHTKEDDTSECPHAETPDWSDADWNTIQSTAKLAESNMDVSRPENRTKANLIEWLEDNEVPMPEDMDSAGSSGSENDDTPDEWVDMDNYNESDDNDENDTVSDEYLISGGVNPEKLSDVREYREKNGECSHNGCVHGANDDSDYCASHQGDDSSSQESPKSNRELSDLNNAEKELVTTLIQEGKSVEEAISMV